MGADIPKVLLELDGRPLVCWVLDAVRSAGIGRVIIVIGHKGDLVREAIGDQDVEFVTQRPLLGTAHAVLQAEPLLRSHDGPTVIMLGDVPRIRAATIDDLFATHWEQKASATLLTALMDDPAGYGRIRRNADGLVDRIVEDRDADDETRRINEINAGIMCFSTPELLDALPLVSNDNAQGEYYLTDVIKIMKNKGLTIAARTAGDILEITGVNSPDQLESLRSGGHRP